MPPYVVSPNLIQLLPEKRNVPNKPGMASELSEAVLFMLSNPIL